MRIRKVLFFFVIFLTASGYCQKTKIVMLDPNFTGNVSLYSDAACIKKSTSIKNNIKDEDFIYFELLKSSENAFYVNARYFITSATKQGWIKKADYIGIYLMASNDLVPVMPHPTDTGKPLFSLKYDANFIPVTDFKNDWLLLKIKTKQTQKFGWVDRKFVCDNPYNSCN